MWDVGATDNRQWEGKDSMLDSKSSTPADLSELQVDSSASWRSMSPLSSAWSLIGRQLHNSLQAGTDGPMLLLEHTGSTNSVSAVGASRSQMGGRTGGIEL